jgi:PilZ domain
MNSTALVASDDLILRSQARAVLNEMRIACICSGTIGFERTAASGKFEAILLDMSDMDAAVAAIKSVRSGKLNRYSIILSCISDGQSTAAAWAAGANFTVRRTTDFRNELKKAFQSAHGLILREKRRYYRHPVSIDAELLCCGRHLAGRMLDISERGACIECTVPIPKQPFEVCFLLPGLAQALRIDAMPAWTHGTKSGIQFTSLDEASQAALSQWLIRQLDPEVANVLNPEIERGSI